MKELSIEEKAKRYDEALERARKLYEQGTITESLSYVFTELKESEDERIIKSFIRLLKAFYDVNFPTPEGFERKDMIAWLEKQGKIVAYYEDRLDECSCKYFNKGYKHALENQGGPKEINID